MILILGYYQRKNLGDDVFEYVWKEYLRKYFPDATYAICNIDDVKKISPDTSVVLFGGGDLINDYFIPKLNKLMQGTNIPYYAVSIGIPYPKLIDAGYLDHFDYIIHRSQVDKDILSEKYSSNRVNWYPDMSYLMLKYNTNNEQTYLPPSKYSNTKKI